MKLPYLLNELRKSCNDFNLISFVARGLTCIGARVITVFNYLSHIPQKCRNAWKSVFDHQVQTQPLELSKREINPQSADSASLRLFARTLEIIESPNAKENISDSEGQNTQKLLEESVEIPDNKPMNNEIVIPNVISEKSVGVDAEDVDGENNDVISEWGLTIKKIGAVAIAALIAIGGVFLYNNSLYNKEISLLSQGDCPGALNSVNSMAYYPLNTIENHPLILILKGCGHDGEIQEQAFESYKQTKPELRDLGIANEIREDARSSYLNKVYFPKFEEHLSKGEFSDALEVARRLPRFDRKTALYKIIEDRSIDLGIQEQVVAELPQFEWRVGAIWRLAELEEAAGNVAQAQEVKNALQNNSIYTSKEWSARLFKILEKCRNS